MVGGLFLYMHVCIIIIQLVTSIVCLLVFMSQEISPLLVTCRQTDRQLGASLGVPMGGKGIKGITVVISLLVTVNF